VLWGSADRTLVMGVLNATTDSFSGDGLADDLDALVALGTTMVLDGADALDIGAASSRPGHGEVPLDVEIGRTTRAVEALRDRVEVPLSIGGRGLPRRGRPDRERRVGPRR
jgi:dihydropteroate synthase